MKKRLFPILLVLVMALALVPTMAFAATTVTEKEPNDSKSTAMKLQLDQKCRGELGSYDQYYSNQRKDADWYAFSLKAGSQYRITISGWNDDLAYTSAMAMFISPDGDEDYISYRIEDAGDDGEDYGYDICYYTAETTGTYYLKIYNYVDYETETEHYYTVSVSHVNHNYSGKITKQATCTEDGVRTYTCAECGRSYTKAIPAGHKYSSAVTKPTYAARGYTTHTCTVCGKSYKDSYTAKKTLAKPAISSVTVSSSGLTVKWNKIANAAGYRVYRSSDGGSYVRIKTITGNSTVSYKDTVATKKGVRYSYKVAAYVIENEKTYLSAYSTAKSPDKIIKLNAGSATLYKGATKTLSATTYPAQATVKWTSGNSTVAKVDSTGKITAVAKGTATITASFKYGDKTYKATCTVTVKNPYVTLNKSSATIYVGKVYKLCSGSTVKLSAETHPANRTITWSSSDTSVATVSASGNVTAHKKGTATITASFRYYGKTYKKTCTITVKQVSGISIKDVSWYQNSVDGIEPEITIKNNTQKDIKYIYMTAYFYNAVGDAVYNEIDGYNFANLKITGPFPAGTTYTYEWDAVFYNNAVHAIRVTDVSVTYMDGSTENLSYNTLWYDDYYYYK